MDMSPHPPTIKIQSQKYPGYKRCHLSVVDIYDWEKGLMIYPAAHDQDQSRRFGVTQDVKIMLQQTTYERYSVANGSANYLQVWLLPAINSKYVSGLILCLVCRIVKLYLKGCLTRSTSSDLLPESESPITRTSETCTKWKNQKDVLVKRQRQKV